MRKNVSGLLSQFGSGVNNDFLAALICAAGFAAALLALALASQL